MNKEFAVHTLNDADRGASRGGQSCDRPDLPDVARDVDHADEAGGSVLLRAEGDGQRAGQHRVKTLPAKRIEFWRVRPVEGGAWLYETKLSNLVELIETETSENHALVLEKTSLTEEEAANMGEFDGW